jgi:hypothetical protein
MTDLAFRDSKVIAFVGSTKFAITTADILIETAVDDFIVNMISKQESLQDQKPPAYLDSELRVALAMNSLKASSNDIYSQVFLLSVLLLGSLSIADRCLDCSPKSDEKIAAFLANYYSNSLPLVRTLESSKWDDDSYTDLIDERLYAVLIDMMSANQLSLDMFDIADRFNSALKSLGFTSLIPDNCDHAKHIETDNHTVDEKKVVDWSVGNLDFSATAFRDILGDKKEVESEAPLFREVTHWHSSRELHVVEEKKTSFWDLKNKQRYIAYVDSYARSLTGPVGLYGMPIIVGGLNSL